MKQEIVRIAGKKLMVVATMMAAISFATFNEAKANSHNNLDSPQVKIEYAGTTDSSILFNVKFNNATGSKFNLIIENENGNVLFEHQYNDKNFDKRIVLVKEPGDAKLSFIVKGAETNYKESFNISTITKIVDDVVVTKAK